MELIKASDEHFDIIKEIVKNTIETVYPNYYPKGAVDFFLEHHSDDAIKSAISNGMVYLFQVNDKIVGTGSIEECKINRLFVLPEFQGKGYGKYIMNELEKIIFVNYLEVFVDVSLPAYEMYVHRGYVPVEYHRIKTKNNHFLCYHVMKKLNNTL